MISSKNIKLLVTLNKMTKNKELIWTIEETPQYFSKGTDDFIPLIYICYYGNKILAAFIRKYKYYHDEQDFSLTEKPCLALLNKDHQIIWEADDNSQGQAMNDLFSSITEQASGIYDLLDDLLKLDPI